ncbi:Atu4866 domain-containing protein [Actinoplanes sp. TRM 88003]|uniref:Atu4866 domain-containing protein n=1 Tax=Paractinoplanes aksuensis TaxID=2939490 RepID=A0ABT1DRF0_9ACTN|nr:Atu4866 domain-containing protein [Actinoplanes aksuensis]MCO8273419.1 Atu4866 domain-containing protein [Actinoplanes aksuensis]
MHQHVDTAVLDAAALFAIAMGGQAAEQSGPPGRGPAKVAVSAPVGSWLSADGTVRLDIRTDGTYAGKVAGRKRRPHGTYALTGRTLTLNDDSGLRTPVAVGDDVLEMAGHRLGRAG